MNRYEMLCDRFQNQHVIIAIVGNKPKDRPYLRIGFVGGEYIASNDNARSMRALAHHILAALGDTPNES